MDAAQIAAGAAAWPQGLLPTDPEDSTLKAQHDSALAILVEAARVDPMAFNSYVLRDEETGSPVTPVPMHRDWHDKLTAGTRVVIWSHVEAGKTASVSVGRVLWELGRNPNLRCVIVSKTDHQAQKICATIGRYINESKELHDVFPHLRPAGNMPWTRHELTVARRTQAKDPSVRTCGVHGSILGARIDLLILDDILDYENTVSPTRREDLKHWYYATLEGRMTRHGKVWCVGTAWHRDDLMHDLGKRPEWGSFRYPLTKEDGTPNWPDRWPQDRIEEKRRALGPLESSRQLDCVARSDEDARFKRAWIDLCVANGDGKNLVYALQRVPNGFSIFTGVDLSVGGKDSDLAVLFTIAVHPNEDREVLDIQAGRWGGPEIVERIIDTHRRYQSIVIVENNGVQGFIQQFTKKRAAIPMHPYTTTAKTFSNFEFGIESIATEMANGKWIIPSQDGRCNKEVEAWIGEMLYYDPRAHAGDRLMASYFAREGHRMMSAKPKAQRGRLDLISR